MGSKKKQFSCVDQVKRCPPTAQPRQGTAGRGLGAKSAASPSTPELIEDLLQTAPEATTQQHKGLRSSNSLKLKATFILSTEDLLYSKSYSELKQGISLALMMAFLEKDQQRS